MLINVLYNSFIYFLIFNITYYLSSGLLFLFDYYRILTNYKKQLGSVSEMVSNYKKIWPTVLMNTLIAIWPSILTVGYYETFFSDDFNINELYYILPAGFIFTDIFFYFSHRILHIPILYKLFHKKHHEITAPIGFCAVYMTTFDLYLGNIVPVYLPLYLMKAHPITFKIWMIISTLNTVFLAHSGFKWFAEFHDLHHSSFKKNYGINLFMDRMFGTQIY